MTIVRRAGYAVLAVQLACFLAWSALLYHRFALTFDFAVYHQPWYLIAHGDLNPYSSVSRLPFWRNDAEFAIWPLAPFWWLPPHDLMLLWLQDIGVVAAEALAFGWLCQLAARWRPGRDAAALAVTGLVLLVANPWTWWAVSFDFHEECIAAPFAVLLAMDLAAGRRRVWAWLAPLLAAGAPAASYVIGVGLGGVVAGRRSRVTGAALMAAGVAYSLLIVVLHADAGAPLARHYGYLVTGAAGSLAGSRLTVPELVRGVASHPGELLRVLWSKRTDLVANLAPPGLLGLGFAAVLPLMLVVILANTLSAGSRFAEPLFQSLPVYVMLPAGTVAVLAWVARRHRVVALAAAAVLAAQAVGWAAVWGPRVPGQWLRIPPGAAAALAQVERSVPESAEVVASQGVIGRFSGRVSVHELARDTAEVPVDRPETWFVIAPGTGTELESTAGAMAMAASVAALAGARLEVHRDGVWAFRWHPPAGVRTLAVPSGTGVLPGWMAPGTGHDVVTGPLSTWHATAGPGAGYVAYDLAWQEPLGRYRATVALSAAQPVNVEIWDDNASVLLARKAVPATGGAIASVTVPVTAAIAYPAPVYLGWGPFRAVFAPPPEGERLEIRVWSPGGGPVNVYRAGLARS
jgi:hypothetical protein